MLVKLKEWFLDTSDNLNINLINILSGYIMYPFVVFDHTGKIILANFEAKRIFRLKSDSENIFDIVDDGTTQIIQELMEDYNEKKAAVSKLVNIVLSPEETFSANLTIEVYGSAPDTKVLCALKPEEKKVSLNNFTAINFTLDNISKYVEDEDIPQLIEKVRALFPFTFIGKEKLRAEINDLDEFFWIKDSGGKYILVNDKLVQSLGVKASQVEGKKENLFLPAYMLELFNSIEYYIKSSLNCVIIEGLFLPGMPASGGHRLIQLPITDSSGNVITFIGFTQKINKENLASPLFNASVSLIRDFPKAVILVDNSGLIRNTSEEFCKLIQSNFSEFINKSYMDVLPPEFAEKIKYFLKSPIDKEEFEINVKRFEKRYPEGFHIFLTKVLDKENDSEGITFLAEIIKGSNDLEKIITDRGPMFDLLIKNNPEPIFIYDTDNLRFLEVNDATLELYGYRRDEFLQMDLTDLYTPEDIQTLLDSSGTKSEGRQFSGPYRHKKKDGSSIFVEISKVPFKYNSSDAHFNLVRDITDKLQLEKNNQLFKAAFDNTEDMLFVTDAEGFVSFINKPVTSLLGYAKNKIDKLSFASLVRNDERATINTSIFQSHLKETVSLITELKKQDGHFVEVEITATPVIDYKSEVDSFIIVGKYKKEEKVPETITEIKEVIKEVVIEKPVPAAPAEGSESPGFLSSLFHEILTPINVILGFVQELTESIENISPEQKESVDIISQNREKLLSTMNSIAEYSNIQKKSAEIKNEEIAITDIIDGLQNDFNEIANTHDVDFAYGRISSSLKFISDKDKFKEFASLLINIAASVSREKKIYFSSYLVDNSSFALSIKDSYTAASKHLIDNIEMLFNTPEGSIVKDFGVSKLSLRIAKGLLQILHGRFQIINKDSDKPDYAFIFPIKLESSQKQYIEEPPVRQKEEFKEQMAKSPGWEETSKNIVPEPKPKFIPAPEEEPEPFIAPKTEPEHYSSIDHINFMEVDEDIDDDEIAIPQISNKPKTRSAREGVGRSGERLDLSQLSCLYIEDQVDSQILFKVQMKELKSIKFAVSFEEALPLLDNGQFDFIVMDINLQGEYNGLDALKIIHKMPEYENIPIIAVTAYVLPGDKEKFIATGFNDFISKPIFREKMIDSLEKIFLMQN